MSSGIQFLVIFISLLLLAQNVVAAAVTRGPYLQMNDSDAMLIKWRTDTDTDSVVRYGISSSNLNQTVKVPGKRINHEVAISGLSTLSQYYYSIGSSDKTLAGGDSSYRFETSPIIGKASPTRIWVIGDAGTANADATAVYESYLNYAGADNTDLWIMLGDNAYKDGTDGEYQAAVFDMYPELLRRTPVWSTIGNHDGHSADSASESGPYYDIFTFPRKGEIGGVASGTEAYYAFDYADIHFVCLDSYHSKRSAGSAMMTWLENDLSATTQKWIIAFWHHPPYTKGSHDSDNEKELIDMRQVALPILERHGVDLVFSGHSHSYERSYLINGHYGNSETFSALNQVDGGDGREDGSGVYNKLAGAANAGVVYTVAGSSGKARTGKGLLNHPAMYASMKALGSVVLDVNDNRIDAKFLNAKGVVTDYYTVNKAAETTTPLLKSAVGASKNSSSVAVGHASENK